MRSFQIFLVTIFCSQIGVAQDFVPIAPKPLDLNSHTERSLEVYLWENYLPIGKPIEFETHELQFSDGSFYQRFSPSLESNDLVQFNFIYQPGGEIIEVIFPAMQHKVAVDFIFDLFPFPNLIQMSKTSFKAEGIIYWLEIQHRDGKTIIRNYSGC
jgi:hypothetical protein